MMRAPLRATTVPSRPLSAQGAPAWDHDMQPLEVLVGDATLCADLVHKAVDEPYHVVGNVGAFGILKAALGVVAVRHTASDAEKAERPLSTTTLLLLRLRPALA